ncbi:MAG: HAMP domain-containing histidine kinase, partial [Leptospiraceae bacterium]|nr:HAMP domain-containing histidine kinase [Leptospiraceae bacterium]
DDITDNLTLINNLKKSNSIKNKFFSIIAHDLKNPFHAIINLTELMSLKEFESSKVQEYISLIHNSSRQGYNLLINLLEWARIQTNSIQIKKTNFNLSETINYNIELLSSNSEEKNLKIEISCPENIPMIFADKNILSTVIRNLLSNGIKFSNKDGFISINSYIKDGMCFISIKDSGIGISNSDQKKLFKLEENFSTPGTGKEKGTGLGLVLCKELIELHGGKISIDSEIGKGTKVSFWIPLKD